MGGTGTNGASPFAIVHKRHKEFTITRDSSFSLLESGRDVFLSPQTLTIFFEPSRFFFNLEGFV